MIKKKKKKKNKQPITARKRNFRLCTHTQNDGGNYTSETQQTDKMKKIIIILTLIIVTNFTFGQNKLVKDIDNDGKNDTVFVDVEKSTIVCNLSTLNYESVSSKPIDGLNEPSGVIETKNGFEFFNDWMRSGFKNQFRYNSKTKKIQLIGMSSYSFGNASNDHSGGSSVNLLTGDYIGIWNYFDPLANNEKGGLVEIPTIRTKMKFKIINLEDFSDETYFNYAYKCEKLYINHKKMNKN